MMICLSALATYTTYLSIGSLADGFGKGVFKPEQVQSLMNDISTMTGNNVKMLKELMEKKKLTESDQKFINKIVEILELLEKEAGHLSDYSKSKAKEDVKKFDKVRKEVWPKITELLGKK